MPKPEKGEDKDHYISRCIPIVLNEGTAKDVKQAAAICHSMWREHLKKKESEKDFFEPPESGNLPAHAKEILKNVYNSCRERWVKEHPDDKENKANKESCSKQAWAAVKNAGYYQDKNGEWKKREAEAEIKTFNFECETTEFTLQSVLVNSGDEPKEDQDWVRVKAVAVVGDRIMRNAFIPYEVLKRSLSLWNGTYHDINHMGTSYPDTNYPFRRQNIDYIIGYQSNAEVNDNTKELSMIVNVYKHSPKYASWKSFYDINTKAGRKPNVSISIDAKFRRMKVRDMPSSEMEYAKLQGFDDDDVIEYLYEIYPKALTTCIQGVCDDKHGCGIKTKNEYYSCDENNCNIEKTNDNIISTEEAKYLSSLKNKIEKIKEEKYLAEINEKIKKIKGGN